MSGLFRVLPEAARSVGLVHGNEPGHGIAGTLRAAVVIVIAAALFGPALARLADALVPVVLVVGLVVAVLRVLWFYTGRW